MPASNLPVRASRIPARGSKLPSRSVNDENAGRTAAPVKSSALPRRPLSVVTNALAPVAPKPVVKPEARKVSSVYTDAGLLDAKNARLSTRSLHCRRETFLQATHSSIDDFDSDDECEDLLSISIDAPADDEILVPTPSIRLVAPTGRVCDRFESTVRYHAIVNEAAAKKVNAPIWLPTGFLPAPQAYPDVNPLPDHGFIDEAIQIEEDEVELLLDIALDTAPQDGDVLVETPCIAIINPENKLIDGFQSEIRHHWVAGMVPKRAMRFGTLWLPAGFLDADNARPDLYDRAYAVDLDQQTRTYYDDAYFAQPAYLTPREDDVDVGVPDIRVVDDEGRIFDELAPKTAFFWVAPEASSVAKEVPIPSRETIHQWFAERKTETTDVQPPAGYVSMPELKSAPAPRAKLPPFPYGRGWSRKDIVANERIAHGEVRFPELLPPSDEPEDDESTHTYVPWNWTPPPVTPAPKPKAVAQPPAIPRKLMPSQLDDIALGIDRETPKKVVKMVLKKKVVKAPVPAPAQPPTSRLRAPVLKSHMPRPSFVSAPPASVAVPTSPKKRTVRRPSALPQPALSRSLTLPAASATAVAAPRSAIPVRTSRLPVLQTRPALPGRV
ncbi:hypothetical protein PENSPDRAFT_668373 [Peniophora sp. CONT]|nr:hypothetical protein PENSPDRAFT_668373 [Peniophora sp. CONT]